MVDSISLHGVIPQVFTQEPLSSGVWGQQLLFKRGERYLLRAESGSGKSSLCSFMMGYRHDYLGEIRFNGESIATYNAERFALLRQSSLAYMPQGLMLFDELSAVDNIELKNSLTHHKSHEWIVNALEALGLRDRVNFPVGKLSYGQRQRVALIRALCQPFDLLLLDEPSSHLDDTTAAAMAALLEEDLSERNATLITMSIGKELEIEYTTTLNM